MGQYWASTGSMLVALYWPIPSCLWGVETFNILCVLVPPTGFVLADVAPISRLSVRGWIMWVLQEMAPTLTLK